MVLQGATTDEGGGIADVAPEPSVTQDGGTDAAAPARPTSCGPASCRQAARQAERSS